MSRLDDRLAELPAARRRKVEKRYRELLAGDKRFKEARSALGREVEAALSEVLDHVRGRRKLARRLIDDPSAQRIRKVRKRLKLTRQAFAERFGLDIRALQEWEQGRRVPDRAARVLLTVIDREPEAVARALAG